MVMSYPHDQDWDDIAEATGDDSWRARRMREYFERLEKCEYCKPNAPGHGFDGYINTSVFDPQILKLDPVLKDLAEAGKTLPLSFFHGNRGLDVNHPLVAKGDTGTFTTPMHVATPVRISIREYLNNTKQAHPDKLTLITGALATKILMRRNRAIGVEFMQGEGLQALALYEANKFYNPAVQPPPQRIYAKREVILSGRRVQHAAAAQAFRHRPGARAAGARHRRRRRPAWRGSQSAGPLRDHRQHVAQGSVAAVYGLPPVPGATIPASWPGRPANGRARRRPFFGPYANNALYTSRISKSSTARTLPDLFIAGQATAFHGFFPGFSQMTLGKTWTWLILKVHTKNTAGTVTAAVDQPTQRCRRSTSTTSRKATTTTATISKPSSRPSSSRAGSTRKPKRSSTSTPSCSRDATGDRRRAAPVDPRRSVGPPCRLHRENRRPPRFDGGAGQSLPRARGRQLAGRRYSAFPKLPGFFPVASVMMIGEKAGDVILEDAKRGGRDDDDHHGGWKDRDD